MEESPFQHEILANRLQQLAYLNKGIKIVFKDEQQNSTDT
jgi:DNA gyrase/topoisomerase IV subunit B